MKKIGAVTFHSSYNFGSNLQAYALQEYIKKISNGKVNYEIINFRTKIQKDMYEYKRNTKGIKLMIKKIIYGKILEQREKNFENFINKKLNLTKEYNENKELEEKFDYDYYISGSDQLWNLSARDFNWAYYLDFVNSGKKISYAASAGPIKTERSKEEIDKIKRLVNEYDYLSVREEGTYKLIKEITGLEPEINVDPTILLTKEDWEKLIPNERICKESYILYYTLKPSKYRSLMMKKLAKKLNKKVVVANPSFKYDIIGGFVKKYEAGPIEFLNLLKNADVVISSSFHGTVFSILFNKTFLALNGKNDFRISTLLKKAKLEDRTILDDEGMTELIRKINDKIDFGEADKILETERKKSGQYLKKALDLGE